jgi:hypothetical protein
MCADGRAEEGAFESPENPLSKLHNPDVRFRDRHARVLDLHIVLRLREDLQTIKIAQLLIRNGTVYQTTPGNAETRNILKVQKIELLPLDTRLFSEKSM